MLDTRVDGPQRLTGIGEHVRVSVPGARPRDQAIGLKPDKSLPCEAVVQTGRLGDVNEPHLAVSRIEGLKHGS